MPEPLRPVAYAPSRPAPLTQRVVHSAHPFEETLLRLKEALAAEDLWLIHEIDPQMILQRGGYAIGAARQLLFFHPRYMTRLLEGDLNALVEVPLKLVILQMPEGGVTVRHPDVAASLRGYAGLEGLADELSAIYARVLKALNGPEPAR